MSFAADSVIAEAALDDWISFLDAEFTMGLGQIAQKRFYLSAVIVEFSGSFDEQIELFNSIATLINSALPAPAIEVLPDCFSALTKTFRHDL
jgi:hypothetical protein